MTSSSDRHIEARWGSPITRSELQALCPPTSSATILVAFLAVPGVRPFRGEAATPTPETASEAATPGSASETPKSDDDNPITTTLILEGGFTCDTFVVDRSLLQDLPDYEFGAEWVYAHGGGNSPADALLTVEGKTDRVVFLNVMRIIDFKKEPPIPNPAKILPCGKGGSIPDRRKFEIKLDDRPSIKPIAFGPNDPPPRMATSHPPNFPSSFQAVMPSYLISALSGDRAFALGV